VTVGSSTKHAHRTLIGRSTKFDYETRTSDHPLLLTCGAAFALSGLAYAISA